LGFDTLKPRRECPFRRKFSGREFLGLGWEILGVVASGSISG
jgi:hypothetical protein